MAQLTSLSLQSADERERARTGAGSVTLLVLLLLAFGAALGFLGYQILERTASLERELVSVAATSNQSAALAKQALDRAVASEAAARAAAEGRLAAELQAVAAREQSDAARVQAGLARDVAARAEAEAAAIRKRAEADIARLEAALGQIAETRRTALGLVMNLGSDYLKFEFDRAELRPEDRELLSRIAGILMTSEDYTVSVNGHTDDVGTVEYNQRLSERRAQAVRDYLVKAGLPEGILSVHGHGKSLPLVQGISDAARAKNRRVELGIVNTKIRYLR